MNQANAESLTWWKKSVIYHIYPRSYMDSNGDGIGDIQGICQRLDYIKSLGVDAIWLGPIYKSPNIDGGYDISDYENINPDFGSMADLRSLCQAAKSLNIKVIMDMVVNHTSDCHAWFQASRSGHENDRRDWYIWRDGRKEPLTPKCFSQIVCSSLIDRLFRTLNNINALGGDNTVRREFWFSKSSWVDVIVSNFGQAITATQAGEIYDLIMARRKGCPPNNWQSLFYGSAWEYDEYTGQYYFHSFAKGQPDLNWDNPEVRIAVANMMDWWLQNGISGFRLDVINLISKNQDFPDDNSDAPVLGMKYFVNGPNLHQYISELSQNVFRKYPEVVTIGESLELTPELAIDLVDPARKELNMVIPFEHMDLSHEGLRWNSIQLDVPTIASCLSHWQQTLHDQGWMALYLSNHDQPRQVSHWGNDLDFRELSAKALCTLNMTLTGTPLVYQGEEIGMTNCHFDDIADYRDIESVNYYHSIIKEQSDDALKAKTLKQIQHKSRDNGRTPMQWDQTQYAGFSTEKPWLGLNSNFEEINVHCCEKNDNSVLAYYRRMIALRKANSSLFQGKFTLLDQETIFGFLKEDGDQCAVVLVNIGDEATTHSIDAHFGEAWSLLIGNYEGKDVERKRNCLGPWETQVWVKDSRNFQP